MHVLVCVIRQVCAFLKTSQIHCHDRETFGFNS